jgi:translocation and assembly module TamB
VAAPLLGEAVALDAAGTLRLDGDGLDLRLDSALIGGGAMLAAQAALRPNEGRLRANATLRGEAGGVLSRLAGLGERPLTLDFVLDGPATGAALSLRAAAGDGVSADLAGTIAAPDNIRLALALNGRADASGLAGTPLAGPLDIALDASRFPDGRIALRDARITHESYRAALRGELGDAIALTFEADATLTDDMLPGASGTLAVQGSATGAAADPALALAARSERLTIAGRALEALRFDVRIANPATRPSGDLRATATVERLPLDVSMRGAAEDAGWLRLDGLDATLGPVRATASGRLNPGERRASGEATLRADDLAPLSGIAGGPIAGAVTLDLRGAPERFGARLAVPRFSGFGATARDVLATAEGSAADLAFALTGEANGAKAETRGRVTTEDDGTRNLDLAALRATLQGETLRLAAPTRITLRRDGGFAIAPTNIALPRSGSLRAEGSWGPERADIRATLTALNLAPFAPLAPQLAPAGTLSGEARINGTVTAPEIAANLRGSGLRFGPPALRTLPPGELRADLRRAGDGALSTTAEARFGPRQRLSVAARFPRGPARDAPFEGTLDGALDLGAAVAPLLAAGADRVAGQLTLALSARGTPDQPQLGGEARLAGGSYRNAVYGVNVSELAGTLRPEGQRLRATMTGRTTGEGRLTLAGTIEPFASGLPADLLLTLTNAQPVASDLVRATMDAELRLAGGLSSAARLSGPIRVQRAELRIPESFGASIRTLSPVREVGRPRQRTARTPPPPAASSEASPIALAITVDAPQSVFVRGRGVDAELGGQLAIGGTLAEPAITGALNLRRGDIAALGRRLAFDRGRLDWQGGLLPELDLRATSQAGGIAARVEVKGSPTSPELIFSSTPELPQDEIVARLLFDRPVRELSPFEIAQIAQVLAGAAGVPGADVGGGFLERMRQTLGLDRLAVASDSERAGGRTTRDERGGAALEAGRYVAPGVYVGVRQGTEGGSRVGVRVDLTPRVRLDAETGDREGGSRVGVSWEWQWGR